MGWLEAWPKCDHEGTVWREEMLQPGNSHDWFDYRCARCPKCDRPLVAFTDNFPESERAFTRRHVSWWYLGKEGEHGGNTAVLPFARTINAPREGE